MNVKIRAASIGLLLAVLSPLVVMGSPTSALGPIPISPAPTITYISPTSGPSSGETVVTITGTNLTTVDAVRFGLYGPEATTWTQVSSTELEVTSPTSPYLGPVAVALYVTTAGGTAESPDSFTYEPVTSTTPYVNGYSQTVGDATSTIVGQSVTYSAIVDAGNEFRWGGESHPHG